MYETFTIKKILTNEHVFYNMSKKNNIDILLI